MAFKNIALQEPSTVTARVATVEISRGSTAEQQEILVLGDVSDSLAVARVLAAAPASTEYALAVRQVGYVADSTTVNVSSVAGIVAVRPSDTAWATSAGFHFNSSGDLKVEVSAQSTVVSVSAFGAAFVSSAVLAGNSSALNVRPVWSSTNTDQPVSAAQAGTWNIGTVTAVTGVSSLAGIVAVRPSDTNWATSAGFHFDGSGNLNVAGSFSASTTVNVSSLAGVVKTTPNDTNWATSAGFHFTSSGELNVNASFSGSTIVTVSTVQGIVTVRPSDTNWATSAGFHFTSSGELNVNASFSGSTIVTVSAFGAEFVSTGVLAGNSSALNVRPVWSSTNTDQPVSAAQSGTWNIGTVTAVTGVSSLAGIVAVRPSDTNWATSAGFHFTSSGELQIAASFSGSTIVTISAFAAELISSGVLAGNSSALNVRPVWSSTHADQPVQAAQSGTWNVGTVTSVSSLAGIVAVRPSDTNWATSAGFHFNSSGEVLTAGGGAGSTDVTAKQGTPAGSSTPWSVRPSDGSTWVPFAHLAVKGSTVPDTSTNLSGPTVMLRAGAMGAASTDVWVPAWGTSAGAQIVSHGQSLLSTYSTNLFISSNFVIGSTTTGQRIKVYAYSITSTVTTAQEVKFYDGANPIWSVVLQAQAGGIAGVNLAVTPPAFLFAGTAGSSMSVNLASSLAGFKAGLSYFVEP